MNSPSWFRIGEICMRQQCEMASTCPSSSRPWLQRIIFAMWLLAEYIARSSLRSRYSHVLAHPRWTCCWGSSTLSAMLTTSHIQGSMICTSQIRIGFWMLFPHWILEMRSSARIICLQWRRSSCQRSRPSRYRQSSCRTYLSPLADHAGRVSASPKRDSLGRSLREWSVYVNPLDIWFLMRRWRLMRATRRAPRASTRHLTPLIRIVRTRIRTRAPSRPPRSSHPRRASPPVPTTPCSTALFNRLVSHKVAKYHQVYLKRWRASP